MARSSLSLLIFLCVLYCSMASPTNKDAFSEATDQMLATFQIYNRDIDQSIPWKRLLSDLSSINLKYEYHSSTAMNLLKKIRDEVTAGVNNYYESSSKMYEWAAYASSSLNIYLQILDSTQYNGTDFIVNVLDDGIAKINASIPLLEQVSRNFRTASNDLESMSQEFASTKIQKTDEYQNKQSQIRLHGYVGGGTAVLVLSGMASVLAIAFCPPCAPIVAAAAAAATATVGFGSTAAAVELKNIADIDKLIETLHDQYNKLSVAVKNTSNSMDKAIEGIRSEINRLGYLRSSIKQTDQYIAMSFLPAIRISVQNLIKKCDDYMIAHK